MTLADKAREELKEVLKIKEPLPILSGLESPDMDILPTGFDRLDEGLNGGLGLGKAYILASVEKAGKTSFLRKMIFQMVSLGAKVGIIDVEQTESFFIKSITAIAKKKKLVNVEPSETVEIRKFLQDKVIYVNRDNGSGIISDEVGHIDIEMCIQAFERMIEEQGVNVCIFDNVTPLASEGKKGSSSQRMMIMNALCSLAKRRNVVVITVGHVNQSTHDMISDARIKDIISGHSDPESIVRETIVTVRRPMSKDVYGGSILSQYDAKFLLWRPFQDYDQEKFRKCAWLMVDDCRYAAPFRVPMTFFGDSLNFVETPKKTENDIFDGSVV